MIFMSYRREDSSGHVNALQDKLKDHFGDAAIVRDLAAIRGGIEFRRFIPETLAKCSVLLALIGPRWLIDKDGRPRLEQEGDLVRAEIAQALQQEGMLVIRVLVGGVRTPGIERASGYLRALWAACCRVEDTVGSRCQRAHRRRSGCPQRARARRL